MAATWVRDDNGQWWYVLRTGARTRGALRTCPQCRVEFPAVNSSPIRFCSRRCATVERGHWTGKGPDSHSWKGGTTKRRGYVMRWAPEHPSVASSTRKYVAEHRLVMEHALGRYLLPEETVHHINGDVTDNRIENLQLRSSAHGPGVVFVCNACGSHDVAPSPLAGIGLIT